MYSSVESFFKDLWVWVLVLLMVRSIIKKKKIPAGTMLLLNSCLKHSARKRFGKL